MMADIPLQLFAVLCLFAITQSSVAQTEGGEISPCNSCCQSPAGLHGIPGVGGSPGHNGLTGRDGMKGEAGSKGDKGDSGEMGMEGPPGPQGPSGERMEQGSSGLPGLAGKVGPQGLAGMDGNKGAKGETGATGEPSLKGEKGLMGAALRGQRSAFFVAKLHSQTGNGYEILTFDHEETNIGGNFNLANSKFTCHIPGVYVFMFTISSHSHTDSPHIELTKDGARITKVHVKETDSVGAEFLQASQSIVLQLGTSSEVWLRFYTDGTTVFGDTGRYTTFSGFLLYEN